MTELFCVHTAQRSPGNTSSMSSGRGATSEEVHSMYSCSNPRQNWTITLATKRGFSWRKQKQICNGEPKFDFVYFTIFLHLKVVNSECIDFVFYKFNTFIVWNCFVVKDVSCLSLHFLKLNKNQKRK